MNCKHCGQEMEPSEEAHRPAMCPNVGLFMDHCLTDTLTGKTYEADANPIHCTESHANHAELCMKEYEEDNADWEHEDGPNYRD